MIYFHDTMILRVLTTAILIATISCIDTREKSGEETVNQFSEQEFFEVPDGNVINVDNLHPDASDTNPGTADLPLKTISAAVVIADDYKKTDISTTVLIHPGTYRESVKLPFINDKSDAKLVYQGTESGKVIISGSDVWTDWKKQPDSDIYTHDWPYDWGVVDNPWPNYGQNLKEIVLRREMIFVNGELLKQVLNYDDLEENSFFISESENKAYMWPSRYTKIDQSIIEVAVRSGLFIVKARTNLEIKGLVFQHDNSGLDKKAVEIHDSPNALVEDCFFIWNNWGGLVFLNSPNITARRNVANHNGGKGIDAWKIKGLLFEDNETSYNNWRGVMGGFTGFAVSGLKHLRIHDGVYRNHTSIGNLTRGFWLDFDNTNIIIENALFKDNLTDAIFIEANEGPITLKNSIICNNKDGRGAIIGGNSENVTIQGNFIYNNGNSQIKIEGNSARSSSNWETGDSFMLDTKNWVIKDNIIIGTDSSQLLIDRTGGNNFLDNFISNNNIWFNSDSEVFRLSRSDFTDFDGWVSITDQDRESLFENPSVNFSERTKEQFDLCKN